MVGPAGLGVVFTIRHLPAIETLEKSKEKQCDASTSVSPWSDVVAELVDAGLDGYPLVVACRHIERAYASGQSDPWRDVWAYVEAWADAGYTDAEIGAALRAWVERRFPSEDRLAPANDDMPRIGGRA